MTVDARIETLDRKHKDLETRITHSMNSPAVDPIELRRMKQMKLWLKDQISELKTRH